LQLTKKSAKLYIVKKKLKKLKKTKSKPLPKKRRLFAEFYDGDGKKAAIKAGYKKKSAGVIGCQLLKVPAIIKLIRSRQNKINKSKNKALDKKGKTVAKAIMTREDRMQFLSDMAQDDKYEPRDRIKSVELLGRMCGDFLGKEDTSLTRTTVYNILVQAREQRGLPNKGQKVIDIEGE